MEPAAGIAAIQSDNSDSSKKFPALVDPIMIMIPSDPQRIIAARASVVSSRESSAARERGEEYKQNSHGEIKNTEQSEENHCR